MSFLNRIGFTSNGSDNASGIRFINLNDTESKHTINLVDEVVNKKKGFLGNVFLDDVTERKSAFRLSQIEEYMRVINNTPTEEPINIIIHTLGGEAVSCALLINAILNHKGTVRAFIPQYAFSAGTLIALACDEIYMSSMAVLGPTDPQIAGVPLNSLMDSVNNELNPGLFTNFMKSFGTKVTQEFEADLRNCLINRFADRSEEEIEEMVGKLTKEHSHGYPFNTRELQKIGFDIYPIKVIWRDIKKVSEMDIEIIKVEEVVQEM